jgi:hypothetical protein
MRGRVWKRVFAAGLFAVASCGCGLADSTTYGYYGTFGYTNQVFLADIVLTTVGSITVQTYGFGGGTDSAGLSIPAGGFDPFVGLFGGTDPDAPFLGGTSDILSNYSPGCPPAGLVTIGNIPGQCGDVNITFSGLAPGTYDVLLSDAEYIPAAVFESSGTFGDGFIDLTGGVFQTCYDAENCNSDTGFWAMDVTVSSATPPPTPTPEPPTAELAGTSVALAVAWMYRREKRSAMEAREGVR